ncbi:hypothetical protein ACFY3G_01845 [Streptomyces phaeochromogenes]|uniref:effector-associated constant component EACC1 n=1 Tax=Streptomyces phaeochromogenes TaxID=1923 RepID=UPI00369D07DF
MQVQVKVAEDDGGATLTDLYRWFRQDSDLRRHADVRLRPPRQTGGFMGGLEVIDLVLSQGFAAANLALAYATWRAGRPAAPPVTITVDGVSVTVRDGSEESVRQIVELLRSGNG